MTGVRILLDVLDLSSCAKGVNSPLRCGELMTEFSYDFLEVYYFFF